MVMEELVSLWYSCILQCFVFCFFQPHTYIILNTRSLKPGQSISHGQLVQWRPLPKIRGTRFHWKGELRGFPTIYDTPIRFICVERGTALNIISQIASPARIWAGKTGLPGRSPVWATLDNNVSPLGSPEFLGRIPPWIRAGSLSGINLLIG